MKVKRLDWTKIKQAETTLRVAAAAGLFDSTEFDRTDWKPRAEQRPEGKLFVYFYGDLCIGWVDGEEATYSTLAEWLDIMQRDGGMRERQKALKGLSRAFSNSGNYFIKSRDGYFLTASRSWSANEALRCRMDFQMALREIQEAKKWNPSAEIHNEVA